MFVLPEWRSRARRWAILLCLAPPAISARAADDLTAMLRVVPADGATTLVVANLSELESMLVMWRPLLRDTGFGAESVTALRRLLPFADWVNVRAPLAFRPPAPGTADKAIYWLHIPQFGEKIAAQPNASEDGGLWRATDAAGVTWFAKQADGVVILSASRINVENAGAPTRTLADVYAPHKELLGEHNLLLHLKSDAYAARLTAALESLAQQLRVPDANNAPRPLSAMAAETLRELRMVADQTRAAGLLFSARAEFLSASVIFTLGDGSVRDYLKGSQPGEFCARHLTAPGLVFGAAWCEPASTSPFLGPWLNRRIGALDAPLIGVLADMRAATLELMVREQNLEARVLLSGGDMQAAADRMTASTEHMDSVRRVLNAFRGPVEAGTPDPWYDAIAPLFPGEAGLKVSLGDGTLGMRLSKARSADAVETSPENPLIGKSLRYLGRQAQFIMLIDPAGLLSTLNRLGLTVAPLSTLPPGPLAGIGVSLQPESIRIDVHLPREALDRIREATTPSGPT